MPPAQESRRITINVDAGQSTAQLKNVADQMAGINKNTKAVADAFGLAGSVSAGFIGALSLRQITSFSDQIQTLNNKLLALTGGQEDATDLLKKLQRTAQDTNSSLQDTTDLFTRMSLALKDASVDSGVMIDFTKTLVNTFRLSGSSAEEAAGKVTSLSYAMQQGGLKGRELRTILRDNTELGNLLKQAFNGNILQAANNGFITTAALMKIIHDNMTQVNDRALQLGTTFGQSLTKILDAFKIKVFELNQELGASGGFASVTKLAIDNMGQLIILAGVLSATALPALTLQIIKLAGSFGLLNPSALIVAGFTAALIAVNPAIAKLLSPIDQLSLAIYRMDVDVIGTLAKILGFVGKVPGYIGTIARGASYLLGVEVEHSQSQIKLLTDKAKDIGDKAKDAGDNGKAALAAWEDSLKSVQDKIKFDKNPFQLLADLNRELDAGTITLGEYNEKIQRVDLAKLRIEFQTGHADYEKFQEGLDKFNTYILNVQLKNGIVSFGEYDEAIRKIDLGKLNRELAAGAISLETYNAKIASVSSNFSANGAFRTGLQDYVSSIGTSTQQVAGLITSTFHTLEDTIFEFVKKGTFDFNKFTQTVLDDLLRIIIRMSIIQPIAQGLLGYASAAPAGPSVPQGGPGNYIAQPNAHGNVYDMGLKRFAQGGVVSAPTIFKYGQGSTGLMGESGPEAIVPLKRASNGDLGVKASITPVTVNIINQSGNTVEQSESTGPNGEKQIEVLITSKVREGLSNGKYDRIFKSAYGINRKGS